MSEDMVLKLDLSASGFNGKLKEFLARLLSSGRGDAVLAQVRYPGSGGGTLALISDPAELDDIHPLLPVHGTSAAKQISLLTRDGIDKKIIALIRPCEIRAVIELSKLKQAALENVFLIGFDCPGVFNMKDYSDTAFDEGHIEKFLEGKLEGIRESCALCTRFTAESGDIAVNWIEDGGEDFTVKVLSEKGKELLSDFEGTSAGSSTKVSAEIIKRRNVLLKEPAPSIREYMDKCLRCYNCREVCPICYCKECLLKPEKMGYVSERYLTRAIKKGKTKMPVDTLLFHLTKMNHMATSCVACGLCEQACPAGIPLGKIYIETGREVQSLFEYEAGRSLSEELPLVTFREEELPEVEDTTN